MMKGNSTVFHTFIWVALHSSIEIPAFHSDVERSSGVSGGDALPTNAWVNHAGILNQSLLQSVSDLRGNNFLGAF
jgi:hypothetical protein